MIFYKIERADKSFAKRGLDQDGRFEHRVEKEAERSRAEEPPESRLLGAILDPGTWHNRRPLPLKLIYPSRQRDVYDFDGPFHKSR